MNRSNVLQVIEYIKGSPETMDYGRWGALNKEQRLFISYLCESWLILDDATNRQSKVIERLNNIIKKLEELELYEFTPDYDYDENLIDGYTPFNIREYIQELKGSGNNE